ncbi:MAG: PhoH family protein [bacterium]|nr:PhoH family protein [bacterium]
MKSSLENSETPHPHADEKTDVERVEIPLKQGELFIFAGVNDRHLKVLRACLSARLIINNETVVIMGSAEHVAQARGVVQELLNIVRQRGNLDTEDIETVSRLSSSKKTRAIGDEAPSSFSTIETPEKRIYLRSANQDKYYQASKNNDIVFAIGPAGTGKSYIAVAMAVQALISHEVKRIVLVRPAVEAGENLGFLPGDLKEKVDPYFRPLYDALMEMISMERLKRYIERNTIEIAPLAYMRGRTLSDSFVILDEAQNTTGDQMKMFLTRLGLHSKAVITGDLTQIDLPRKDESGLLKVTRVLRDIPGIEFIELTESDTARHELVRRIIIAYQEFQNNGK